MSETGRGLPLLSGPPPSPHIAEADKSCRRCNKEFAFLIVRHRKCNHCGYSFCHNCTDYQALMPRENGYDAMNVCGFCIEYLTMTAAGRGQLKAIPMSKLRNYINAYNIETVDRIVEKEDLIDAIVNARGPNGCLPPGNEEYYRKHSIPNKISPGRSSRGFFSTSRQGQNTGYQTPPPKVPPRPSPPEFARPDLQPDNPPPPPPPPQQQSFHRYSFPNAPGPGEPSDQRQRSPPFPAPQWNHFPPSSAPPPPPPPPRPPSTFSYATPPSPQFHTPPFGSGYGRHPSTNHTSGSPPPPPQFMRPTTQSTPQPGHGPGPAPTPPPPSTRPRARSTASIPTLDGLLSMPPESIGSLSIKVLKSILFTNHVNVTNILEKGDLVIKVIALVEDEKRERERVRVVEEMEEMEKVQRQMEREGVDIDTSMSSSTARDGAGSSQQGGQAVDSEGVHPVVENGEEQTEINSDKAKRPASNIFMSAMERNGLCVVCQDDDANIAIVDCGHLAMCRSCSDLVMSSTKECPLCRTRIVTEARLLRIFKT